MGYCVIDLRGTSVASPLDAIVKEMSELSRLLDESPEDARVERAAVRDQQNALRGVAAMLRAEHPRTVEGLQNELVRLLRQHEAVVAAAGAGGGPGGGDMIAIMERLAKRVDEAQGRAELEARIHEVRRRLASDDSAGLAT